MKIMKKIKILATALLASGLLLAGCATNKEQSSAPQSEQQSSQEELVSYLSFLESNKIRFDIMDNDLGYTFKYQGQAITSGEKVDMGAGALSFTGESEKEKLNFIIVTEKKPEEGRTTGESNIFLSVGLRVTALEKYASQFAEKFITPNAQGKVYVAISDGSKAPSWTTGLDAKMDKAINNELQKY